MLSCSHSCLASPAPGRASFSELGSHRVNLDLPYLGGLKSFQQPPITAGVVGRVKEPTGNISASHSHNMPAAAKLGPVSCVLEAVPRLLSRGPRLLGLGPRELSPFTSSNEISSSLGTSLGWVNDMLWLLLCLLVKPVGSFPAPPDHLGWGTLQPRHSKIPRVGGDIHLSI